MKLLLAEDTTDLNRVVTVMLEHSGFTVDSVFDGQAALDHILKEGYDGILLDIMMPKMDGITVLKKMRENNIQTPVLLLTAKAEVDDRVAGLDAGADDYLPKPFAMKELLARVKAMTRRRSQYSNQNMAFADFTLDAETFALTSENSVRLSVKEFELLQSFMLNAEKPLTTEFLLSRVWAAEPEADGDTVWLYVSYLRRKLAAISSGAVIQGDQGGSYELTRGGAADE